MFFSKNLLRHPIARSDLSEFTGDSHFRWLIPDDGTAVNPRRVIFCSGQVYAALHKARAAREINDVAIVRVEQLHPFPWAQVREVLEGYEDVKEVVWAQEEPLNAGAWSFVQPRMETILTKIVEEGGDRMERFRNLHVKFVGRAPSASVATGMKKVHVKEEEELVAQALSEEMIR